MTNKEKRALFIEAARYGARHCFVTRGWTEDPAIEAEALRRYPKPTKTVPNEVVSKKGTQFSIRDGVLHYRSDHEGMWLANGYGDCTPEVLRQLLESPTMEVEVDE